MTSLLNPAHPFYLFFVSLQIGRGKPAGRVYQAPYTEHLRWHAACILVEQSVGEMLALLDLPPVSLPQPGVSA